MINESALIIKNKMKVPSVEKEVLIDAFEDLMTEFNCLEYGLTKALYNAIENTPMLKQDDIYHVNTKNISNISLLPMRLNEHQIPTVKFAKTVFDIPEVNIYSKNEMMEYVATTLSGVPYINIWFNAHDCLGALMILYWDGSSLRLYTPIHGNYIDVIYKCPILAEYKDRESHLEEMLRYVYEKNRTNKRLHANMYTENDFHNINPGYYYLYAQGIVVNDIEMLFVIPFDRFDPLNGKICYPDGKEYLVIDKDFQGVPLDFIGMYNEINQVFY